ncbi:MAG TPA: hypothetical protein VG033_06700 [Candidatus Acidoferrales bacterium]|jgi:hypothetical protein|nr:hypothetical protein [Candidatus Acidoferrales bacterium]
MRSEIRPMNVDAARKDLEFRTLQGIDGDMARLVYVASTRDYNTGKYYHDGLAAHFSEEIVDAALAASHQEVFRRLVFSPLEELVQQLETYLGSTHAEQSEILQVWQKLQPYRVTIPLGCDPLSAELFFSNLRIALAILESRLPQTRPNG